MSTDTFTVRFCFPPISVSPSGKSTGCPTVDVTTSEGTLPWPFSLIVTLPSASLPTPEAMLAALSWWAYTGNSERPFRVTGWPTEAVISVASPSLVRCSRFCCSFILRRLPTDRRLAHLLRDEADVETCTRRLAHQLAAFHSTATRTEVATRAATASSTLERWETNAQEMQVFSGRYFGRGASAAVLHDAEEYVSGRRALFDHRIESGRAVDGHGDLLAQDIFCLDDGPAVLDCLEFDPALRSGDVLGDVAFLAMDIERIGRADVGWNLLEMHRELLDDDWPTSLAHHHIAYRAQVRAKVACIRIAQGGSSDEDPDDLLTLAARHLRLGRVDLIVVGGLPGSGKSTVASEIGSRAGAVVLSSDEIRKELAGVPSLVSAAAAPDEGIYAPGHSRQTYDEVLERAGRLLEMGESVVLDASFTDPRWRERARELGRSTRSRLTELNCVAPIGVLEQRVESRRAAGPSVSDAGAEIVRTLAARATPWPQAIELDTTRPVAETVALAMGVTEHSTRG